MLTKLRTLYHKYEDEITTGLLILAGTGCFVGAIVIGKQQKIIKGLPIKELTGKIVNNGEDFLVHVDYKDGRWEEWWWGINKINETAALAVADAGWLALEAAAEESTDAA